MKQLILTGMVVLFVCSIVQAQNNIGIGTSAPDSSAMLEILSTNKGLLVPRMTTTERLAIPSPANALLVYDIDSMCFYYFKQPATTWINLCTAFSETDPEVGINTTNYISKWNGSSLVTSNVFSSGTFTGINATTPIGSSQFVVGSTSPFYSGMYVNTAGTTGARRPFYGYALGGISGTWTYLDEATNQWRLYHSGDMVVVESSGNVGIGTLTPTEKLDVNGKLRVRDLALDNSKDSVLVARGDGTISFRNAASLIAETDKDSTNELQQLTTSGDTIFISNGNYILLPGLSYLSFLVPTVQERLDNGQTPIQIFNSGIPLDSLYGKTYQGGLIAYLNTSTGYGLIAATTNLGATVQWGCNSVLIPGADGTAIGTGFQNTLDIEAACTTAGIAADLCANLILNSYSDWFLPSKDELNQLYLNLKLNGSGAFTLSDYWSSTEFSNTQVWSQHFGSGNQFQFTLKSDYYRVRAVRAF